MFAITNELIAKGYDPIVTVPMTHAPLPTHGVAFSKSSNGVTAMIHGGHYSPTRGITHYGNSTGWLLCGAETETIALGGYEVNCKRCKHIFKKAFPVRAQTRGVGDCDVLPCIPSTGTEVKFSHRPQVGKMIRHSRRKDNSKWRVATYLNSRKEGVYRGESLRTLMAKDFPDRDELEIMTYWADGFDRPVGIAVCHTHRYAPTGRVIIQVPAAVALVVMRLGRYRYITAPLTQFSDSLVSRVIQFGDVSLFRRLGREWVTYKSYQDAVSNVILKTAKPARCPGVLAPRKR